MDSPAKLWIIKIIKAFPRRVLDWGGRESALGLCSRTRSAWIQTKVLKICIYRQISTWNCSYVSNRNQEKEILRCETLEAFGQRFTETFTSFPQILRLSVKLYWRAIPLKSWHHQIVQRERNLFYGRSCLEMLLMHKFKKQMTFALQKVTKK